MIRSPIVSIINVPKPQKYHGEIYSPKELLELLDATKDTIYEVPIALAGVCGLRRGECLGLREEDVDFSNNTIRINSQLVNIEDKVETSVPKSMDSSRVISAPPEVMEILKRKIAHNLHCKRLLKDAYNDDGYIVCYNDGSIVNPRNFTKAFSNMLEAKKLKKIRFHDLRHTCASLMLTADVPLKTVSQILGHSSISITADLYTHVVDKNKQQAAEKVKNILFPPKK